MATSPPQPLEGTHAAPPEISTKAVAFVRRLTSPIEAFLSIEAASGVLLVFAAAAGLALANSAWAVRYQAILDTPIGFVLANLHVEESLRFWINEGLMTFFFFVVGLEIRREVHDGELSTLQAATVPIIAALGGMVVPAVLYLAVTWGQESQRAWGVPMATDIAFALGVLTLLGPRVPPVLRVLLLAIAIIDDIGSILVIALFYSGPVRLDGFALALGAVGSIFVMQRFGVRRALLYLLPGLGLWLGVLRAGIHPAIAGVILGLLTPARAWLGPLGLLQAARESIARIERDLATGDVGEIEAHALAREARHLESVRREALSPATRLQIQLHPWVAFVVMPVFALANSGVELKIERSSFDSSSLGIVLGLLLGKPAGIALSWLVLSRLGLRLPRAVGWREVLTLGLVAGIGFTMALFIGSLAFPRGPKLDAAKLAIMAASLVAMCLSVGLGRWLLRRNSADGTPPDDPRVGGTNRVVDAS